MASTPRGPTSQGGILARLRASKETMTPAHQRLTTYILNGPERIVEMSVTEVADGAGVSDGSVVGFCKSLNLKGFQDLKLTLARELVEPVHFIHEDLVPSDDATTVIRKILLSDIQALQDTLKVLDPLAMQRAAHLILTASHVEFYGIGSAAPVAIDAHYRMRRIGVPCSVYTDSHMQAISASLSDSSKTTVTISHSGSTMETLAATRLAKETGAATIVITNVGKSPIQEFADVVLYTAARETKFRTEAMTSRIAELSIVDALYACVALANYEQSLEKIRQSIDVISTKRF